MKTYCGIDLTNDDTGAITGADAGGSVVNKTATSIVPEDGDLTDAQAKEVLDIAKKYRDRLLSQWSLFKQGKPVRIIKIKKTK